MKTPITLFLYLLSTLFLYGCKDKEVDPSDNFETGTTLTAAMGDDLARQVYIDLSEGKMTSIAVNTWELAFEKEGNAIRTNSAKKVAIAIPATTNFDEVTDDEGLDYAYDSSDGDLGTTALNGWETNQPYVINLGIDENGNNLGTKKFRITAKNSTSIAIQFAELDGSQSQNVNIDFDEGNFTFYSLINAQKVVVEPARWDLVLTAVSLRTGAPCASMGAGAKPGVNCDIYRLGASAMTNTYQGVQVAVDDPFEELKKDDDPEAEKNQQTIESSNFDDLGISDFNTLGASSSADAIGRTWLQILEPHSSGVYKVYDFITYIVKDTDGNYYKLRFLAYKGGDNAENGYPTFEYELLAE
ncbi:HmuY family protein [Rapidithrix thailandica]|uniref:HmuY family protein n=1 Tax=Rapidithrix thailandica TaxID=413964 RepID=A0AAW9SC01_9BACT